MVSKYAPIALGDEKFDCVNLEDQRRPHSVAPTRWVWVAHAVLLLSSIMFCIRGYIYSRPTTKIYVDEYSTYSPAAKAVQYSDVLFNATTHTSPPSSAYIGRSSAVDRAWESLSLSPGPLLINEAELYLLEKPASSSVKISDPSSGKSGYRVELEVFHQLRCLNTIRLATYRTSQNMETEVDNDSVGMEKEGLSDSDRQRERWTGAGVLKGREEIDHCLEILRMNLMCQADIGLVTFTEEVEREGKKALKPDFGTWHTCRNFEGVVDWVKQNAVKE